MRTEQVLQSLASAVQHPEGDKIIMRKIDAELILIRVNFLEDLIKSLIRSCDEGKVVLPYRSRPQP